VSTNVVVVSTNVVTETLDAGVGTVVLLRPGAMNALTVELVRELAGPTRRPHCGASPSS